MHELTGVRCKVDGLLCQPAEEYGAPCWIPSGYRGWGHRNGAAASLYAQLTPVPIPKYMTQLKRFVFMIATQSLTR